MGAARPQRSCDHLQHGQRLQENLVVPKAEYPIPLGFDSSIAAPVVFVLFEVLAAVELDHDLPLEAREIGDVARNRNLTSEPITM